MTEWHKIPGLPERFEASDQGEIRSLPYEVKVLCKNGTVKIRQIAGKTLKQRRYEGGKSNGHPVVSISSLTSSGAKTGEQRVSVMVARAFHGCPYQPGDSKGAKKWRIMFIDGDITNCAASNLDWATSNGMAAGSESNRLYEENIRKLEQQRIDPTSWVKRVFGEDVELEDCVSR